MTTYWKAVATLTATSGEIEDRCQNEFWFIGPSGDPLEESDDIVSEIDNFYNDATAEGHAISDWISETISRSGYPLRIDVYDADAFVAGTGPLGSPVWGGDRTLGAPISSQTLPDQISMRLSYRSLVGYEAAAERIPAGPPGPEGDIKPRARLRGGIWLGPLQSEVLTEDGTTHQALLRTTVMVTCVQAGVRLRDAVGPLGSLPNWGIYSRANGNVQPIGEVRMDNRLDVQRRRARKATSFQSSAP